jgi:hypothetical protein
MCVAVRWGPIALASCGAQGRTKTPPSVLCVFFCACDGPVSQLRSAPALVRYCAALCGRPLCVFFFVHLLLFPMSSLPMRSVLSSVFCAGLVFPIASLRLPLAEHPANVVFPRGVLEEARNVLQRGCGRECLKEACLELAAAGFPGCAYTGAGRAC